MPKINSRAKGARGELLFSKFMKTIWGISARRGQQFSGGNESPDVVHLMHGVHFEVKNVETLKLGPAYLQASEDAGPTNIPIVAHKRNNQPWMLTFAASDLEQLCMKFMLAQARRGVSETKIVESKDDIVTFVYNKDATSP